MATEKQISFPSNLINCSSDKSPTHFLPLHYTSRFSVHQTIFFLSIHSTRAFLCVCMFSYPRVLSLSRSELNLTEKLPSCILFGFFPFSYSRDENPPQQQQRKQRQLRRQEMKMKQQFG